MFCLIRAYTQIQEERLWFKRLGHYSTGMIFKAWYKAYTVSIAVYQRPVGVQLTDEQGPYQTFQSSPDNLMAKAFYSKSGTAYMYWL